MSNIIIIKRDKAHRFCLNYTPALLLIAKKGLNSPFFGLEGAEPHPAKDHVYNLSSGVSSGEVFSIPEVYIIPQAFTTFASFQTFKFCHNNLHASFLLLSRV
jgi:hypothetical protein